MLYIKLLLQFLLGASMMISVHGQDDEFYDEVPEEEESQWVSKKMPYARQNIQVPRAFWDVVKLTFKEDGVEDSVFDDMAILPISIQVEIGSTDSYVLKEGKNYRLLFIEGGGDLDLFDYVAGKGEFYFRMNPGFENDNRFHIFYISDSPGKQVGGDAWGNGCGKIFDLSEKGTLFMLDNGIRLTSARRQNMHLMAGTFIMTQLVDDRLYMGYIRVADSRYPQFNCHAPQD